MLFCIFFELYSTCILSPSLFYLPPAFRTPFILPLLLSSLSFPYSQWSSSGHSSSHELRQRVIDEEKESYRYIDQDYTGFNPSLSNAGYNYLDSNFRPAL